APSTNTAQLYVDRDGGLWVPTDRGLARRAGEGWQTIGREQGLEINSDVCLLQDREGSLWIGLGGGGLARWLGYNRWESWTTAEGLSNPEVWSIARDTGGTLWAGTESGLSVLGGAPRRWKTASPRAGLDRDRIRAVFPHRDGRMWIGASPGGVSRLDPRTGAVEAFGPGSGLDNDRVTSLRGDAAGRVWVTTWGGVFRSRAGGRTFERLDVPGVSDDHFSNLLEDRQGRMWVSGAQGLAVWNGTAWQRFTTAHGLKNGNVQRLAEAPDGSIWIGYLEGLGVSRLSLAAGQPRIVHFTRENGLRSDKPIFLATDRRGWLWLGSDEGLDVYNGELWRHFGSGDGLVWNDCSANAVLVDGDGSVWIGTSRGLSHFRPPADLFHPDDEKGPPVVITGLKFGDGGGAVAEPHRVPYDDR
ncbi:MAG: ligand-binding sensor domain-containing protein, partial [Bryobacteraceae bacterium]